MITPSVVASVAAALLVGRAMQQQRARATYTCPLCGSKRPDGHASECPWGSRR